MEDRKRAIYENFKQLLPAMNSHVYWVNLDCLLPPIIRIAKSSHKEREVNADEEVKMYCMHYYAVRFMIQ